MAIISITITESPIQKVAGIPKNIILTTNIPATIFYTLDGTTPTTSSSVAVGAIDLPTDENTVVLKAFATDGVDTSAVITQSYGSSIADDRRPHFTVTGVDTTEHAHFPFADASFAQGNNGIYGNTGGVTVDKLLEPGTPVGYDGTHTGTPASYMIPPLSQYSVTFSETDSIGQRGRGIGTLPASVTVIKPRNDNTFVEESDTSSPFFNPRALVIYQDSSDPQFDDNIAPLNRPYFSLENPGKVRDGALLQSSEGIATTGSFLRSHFNPRNNTITYYYYDNTVGRWIISTEPYVAKDTSVTNLSRIVFSSRGGAGSRYVYKWYPFRYRKLF